MTASGKPLKTEPNRLYRKRHFYYLAAIIIGIGILLLTAYVAMNWGSGKAVGIYLANGGQQCVQITRGPLGRLKVESGAFENMLYGFGTEECNAAYRLGTLRINQERHSSYLVSDFRARLLPSEAIEGDWDLSEAHVEAIEPDDKMGPIDRASYAYDDDFRNIFKAVWAFIMPHTEEVTKQMSADYLPSRPKIRSFLHRIDHPELLTYFEMRREEDPPEKCLEILNKIASAYPDDPFLMLHRVELEAQCGNIKTARQVKAQWESQHQAKADPLLLAAAKRTWINLEHYAWKVSGKSAHYSEMFVRKDIDNYNVPLNYSWQDATNWVELLSEEPHIQYTLTPLVTTHKRYDMGNEFNTYHSIYLRQFFRLITTEARFAMLQGDFDKARRLLTGLYFSGRELLWCQENIIVPSIGCHVLSSAQEGLQDYILNCPLDESEYNELMSLFSQLNATLPDISAEDAVAMGSSLLIGQMYPDAMTDAFNPGLNWHEIITNGLKMRKTHNDLLNMAARAKWYRQRTGEWPSDHNEIETQLGLTPIADRFQTSSTLRMAIDGEDLVIYSVGLNAIDDRTLKSGPYEGGIGDVWPNDEGDIAIRIPAKPQYPFSREGIRADNADDLLSQFPQGLPIDPTGYNVSSFYSRRKLSILDSTTTQALTVFTIGGVINLYPSGILNPSDDFDMKIKKILQADPRWKVYSRDLQPVFTHENAYNPELFTTYTATIQGLEKYDPTNGAASRGSLFITIPPRAK